MDENMSRGYVLLKTEKWKNYSPRYRYQRYQRRREREQERKEVREGVSRLGQSPLNDPFEEDEYLHEVGGHSTPTTGASQPTSAGDMGGISSNSRSAPSSFYFQPPPKDRFNGIYLGLLLAGVGFLLPYNSFVIAVDYFQSRYPGTTIIFDMSFVYIFVAFGAVILNNILVESISLYWRINFGYLISLVTLLVVALFEIGWESFPPNMGYRLNLVAVAVVAFGCTVQQSSFYGYTSMLPSRYTQAVMTGESAAGLIVSFNRILTKLLLDDEKTNTLLFFAISIGIVICCIFVHNFLQKTAFVRFYVSLCSSSTTTLTSLVGSVGDTSSNGPTIHANYLRDRLGLQEDVGLVEMLDPTEVDLKYGSGSHGYGILKLTSPPPESGHSRHSVNFATRPSIVSHSDSTEFDMPFGIDEDDLHNYQPPTLPGTHRSKHAQLSSTVQRSKQSTITSTSDSEQGIIENELHTEYSGTLGVNDESTEDEKEGAEFRVRFKRFATNLTGKKKRFTFGFGWDPMVVMKIRCDIWYQNIRSGLISRWEVSRITWPYMLSICTAYFVTLSLFPGIESEITSCRLRSWMPVIIMAVFNLTDFVGKVLASFFYSITTFNLMNFSCLRVLCIPLLCLCVAPREHPFFYHELWPIFFSGLLGISNGILGSLPMILAPLHVPDDLKEITGNIITLSYSVGLTTGSALAYVIDYLLGPTLTAGRFEELCQKSSNEYLFEAVVNYSSTTTFSAPPPLPLPVPLN